MNWISVKENLPAEGQPVLLYNANATDNTPLQIYQVAALANANGVPAWAMPQAAPQSLTAYTHWMALPDPPLREDEQFEAIKMVADSIVSHHIPAGAGLQEFTFPITVEGTVYQVTYEKDIEGYWAFSRYE
ncbi:DUF551 domain-containing protein [Mucilaginibacter sp. Bleaf8]|uniref:DUF551 domain-containing protein n=1 Tax=Mucilaginibacter sp. Bleaf8 TaxID=2834430 RepID=UPI001BCD2DD8|nr:DUF551 domain-containing protein [Mucilaginibacter sp. Bleaf8]MBS7563785.1 DUF551 domain-containing protein [Mucilaginibacter sp. Bleaf8]